VVKGPHEVQVDGRSITVSKTELSRQTPVHSVVVKASLVADSHSILLHLASAMHAGLPVVDLAMQVTPGFCRCCVQLLLLIHVCSAVRMCSATRINNQINKKTWYAIH
jgi:hypothetical protein